MIMKRPENDKWLDEALSETIGSEKPGTDFEQWKQKHPQAVEMLTSRARSKTSTIKSPHSIRNTIMKNPITKLAAAAVIIVGVVLTVAIWEKTTPPAYALEQTIQASHSVRYLRIKDFKKGMEEPKEFWLEFDEHGDIKNIRAHMPEWESPSDGAKVVIWREGKATVWFKKKKALLTIKEKRFADKIAAAVHLFDPKLAIQRFSEMEKRGLVKIEIEEPSKKTEPVIVTATYLPEAKEFGLLADRTVLFVDQTTKLLISLEGYHLAEGGDYELTGWTEFHDYNQRIDPHLFVLDDLPSDVMQIDQTIQDIGLEQGDLSDEEIAVKVVREFYEALIAKDYAKAGRLLEGIPAARIEEMFEDLKIVRIISIGEPKPHPTPGVGGFMVPCKLEIEKDGTRSVYEPYGPGVRPVYNQPNRWGLHGGVK
jgi:hypothetical protein